MRILLTMILVKSGVLTHVWDMVHYLTEEGVDVAVAILNNDKVTNSSKITMTQLPTLLGPKVPYCFCKSADQLKTFTKLQKVQLIHAHSSLTFPYSLKVARSLSIPLIITLHGVFPWKKFFPVTIHYAKEIIAIGPAQAQSAGPDFTHKMHIIENGVDIEKFRPDSVNEPLDVPLRIIWFGRTNGSLSKGVRVLDKAIHNLRLKGRRINAKLVGRTETTRLTSFELYGWENDPVSFLRWSHIAFGQGRSLREAMASGNVGFLLAHGYGGRVKREWFSKEEWIPVSAIPEYGLAEPKQEEIEVDLEQLYNDRLLLKKLRYQARQIAEAYFDARNMVKRNLAIYIKVLN